MYKGPIKNYLCAAGCKLTPATLIKALALADLTWAMPLAQYVALQFVGLQNVTTIKTEIKADSAIFRHEQPIMTLLGLPVEIDRDLPVSTVQLRYKGATLFEIQNLATPSQMEE